MSRLIRAKDVLYYLDDTFTFRDFAKIHPLHRSTAYRDLKGLLAAKIVQKIGCAAHDTRVPLYRRVQVR